MDISQRQKVALDMLLRGQGDTTLSQIAGRLRVSSRTIHRELARIAPELNERYGLVLSSRSGHGLQVIGESSRIQACLAELQENPSADLPPEERRRMVAAILLDTPEVTKLFALSCDLGIPSAMVRSDLELLRPWFGLYGLQLVLRRGLGVSVEGDESSRRQAFAALVMEQFGEAGILSLIRGEASVPTQAGPSAAYLRRLAPAGDFIRAENVLAGLPRGSLPVLAPLDYLGLVVHLAVALSRQRQGVSLKAARAAASSDLPVAREIVLSLGLGDGSVQADADASIHEAEILAIEQFLRGAKPGQAGAPLFDGQGIGSLVEVQELINACTRFSNLDFSDDRVLRDGLAAHWGPAWYRVAKHLPIRNPLLDQIKRGYPELFALVTKSVAWVFPELEVPEDEIGYLVLHFGSSLERRGKSRVRFRALVVCSAGIGSANMLASRIRTELPEIDIVANLSWFDVKDVAADSWDILVSTIPLPLDQADYILVSPLLDEAGVRAIRDCLDRRRIQIRQVEAAPVAVREDSTLNGLKQMGRHLTAVIGLLEHLEVFTNAATNYAEAGWTGVLAAALGRAAAAKLVSDPGAALRDLAERSTDRGILLPGSRILFLHTRSVGVAIASLSIHVLDQPLPDETGAWKTTPTRLVLMLAPRRISRETQDILNEISVSFLDARTVEILREADAQTIRSHYTRYLDRYFRSFPNQGLV